MEIHSENKALLKTAVVFKVILTNRNLNHVQLPEAERLATPRGLRFKGTEAKCATSCSNASVTDIVSARDTQSARMRRVAQAAQSGLNATSCGSPDMTDVVSASLESVQSRSVGQRPSKNNTKI